MSILTMETITTAADHCVLLLPMRCSGTLCCTHRANSTAVDAIIRVHLCTRCNIAAHILSCVNDEEP